ncbi:MAG: nspV [Myxococcaceae bacterium]|nr:nspV [Myxococcaceae bacterium]
MARAAGRIERGDWQTPRALAESVLDRVTAHGGRTPRTVLEPTCGEGTFLVAAKQRFPRAALVGYEIDAKYTRAARAALGGGATNARYPTRIETRDFFAIDWGRELAAMDGPLLVIGNPPWVTSAQLGVLGSSNLPEKENARGLRGLDALTGKSNFDVSEWMLVRLLEALAGRDAIIALLCKSAVARRVVETIAAQELAVSPVGLWRVDAARHFDASVSAVLFVAETRRATRSTARRAKSAVWPVYADLEAKGKARAESSLGMVDGVLVADAERFARTRHLAGTCAPEWRSGVKHDCARIMELERPSASSPWRNGLGETVDIEAELVHPLLKSSDVANQRATPRRAMIVTQRSLGEDTAALRRCAPRAWKYLLRHRALLDARKSSIYEKQPPFAIFGIGAYSFAPWKVAISAFYKRSTFTVVGPHEGRPVVLDDTCYFLAFDDEAEARRAARALRSRAASDFLGARIFWDAKRPITKGILQTLDLQALLR